MKTIKFLTFVATVALTVAAICVGPTAPVAGLLCGAGGFGGMFLFEAME